MKAEYYIAGSMIIIEVMIIVVVALFVYLGPEPEYLSWFGVTQERMSATHRHAYYAFTVLSPFIIILFLIDSYRYFGRKGIRFDKKGIYDNFTLKGYDFLPWENITAVEIQVAKYNMAIIAIHLDKPVKNKHVIKIDRIGLRQHDFYNLSANYPKIEETNTLSIFK